MSNVAYSIGFPGREAFYKGLDISFYKQFVEFREIYDIASDCINENLYEISFKNQSQRPELHAVCLITYCYALYKVLLIYLDHPSYIAGFSQGEFTAITVAGGLAFPEVLKLVHRLEALVVNSKKVQEGTMVRIVELDRDVLEKYCNIVDPLNKSVSIAIYLSKDQNIISGDRNAVNKVCELAKQYGCRWAIPLSSGGAFHSPICSDILPISKLIFDEYEFSNTRYKVYSCSDGNCSSNGDTIKKKLSKQISLPIMWDKIINGIYYNGIRHMIELGPGCTLSGNSRIICPDIKYLWLCCVDDLENVAKIVGNS